MRGCLFIRNLTGSATFYYYLFVLRKSIELKVSLHYAHISIYWYSAEFWWLDQMNYWDFCLFVVLPFISFSLTFFSFFYFILVIFNFSSSLHFLPTISRCLSLFHHIILSPHLSLCRTTYLSLSHHTSLSHHLSSSIFYFVYYTIFQFITLTNLLTLPLSSPWLLQWPLQSIFTYYSYFI